MSELKQKLADLLESFDSDGDHHIPITNALVEKIYKLFKAQVIVEVSGGVADVSSEPEHVSVIIVDHDNLQEENLDFDPIADPKALKLWLNDDSEDQNALRIYLGNELMED